MYTPYLRNQQTVIATSTSTNSTTSFADVTGMSFPMMANTIYQFHFDIIFQTAATTTGIGFGVNGPASPTYVLVRTEIPTSLTAVTQGMQRAYDTGTSSTAIDTINVNCYAKCYGYVSNGANAGNLLLRFKSEVGTSQVSIMAGTMGRLWRISPSN
jgi:hypothetical protein